MKLFNYDIPDDIPIYRQKALMYDLLIQGLQDGTLGFGFDSTLTDNPDNPTAPPVQTIKQVYVERKFLKTHD